jgi:hypothetical protein
LLRLSRISWLAQTLRACVSSFSCASGEPAADVPSLALLPVKDYEHGLTRRYNNRDEASAKVRKDIKRPAKLSLSPKFDEAIRDGALALLPGERFVILDFEVLSSLGLADS